MKNHGFPHLYNYVDDLIYCCFPYNIHQSFGTLLHILKHLYLTIIPNKLVSPCSSMVCLGILINTDTRTMSVPADKLKYVLNMWSQWQQKHFRQLQSLLGSLLHVSKCVKPAHTFVNWMLTVQNYGQKKNFFSDPRLLQKSKLVSHFLQVVY